MIKEYYCPACNNKIVVKHIGTDFKTCECANCGGIMIESDIALGGKGEK